MANLSRGPAASALPNLQGQLKNNQGKVYAYADLPTDPNTPLGTNAWTSDNGLCIFDGTAWSSVYAGNPVGPLNSAQSFKWSGALTTAVAANSDALPVYNAGPWTFSITANAGVTAFNAVVDGASDAALSSWTAIAAVSLTAAGTSTMVSDYPYYGYRVRVVAITGGSSSATIQRKVGTNSTGVVVSPSASGIPQPGPILLAQTGIPVICPGAANMGVNGAITLTPNNLWGTPAAAWIYLPADAIFTGSAANYYYVVFSTQSNGIVYQNTLPLGTIPYVIPSPTAWTGKTGNNFAAGPANGKAITLGCVKIPGGSLGPNGIIDIEAQLSTGSTGGTSTFTFGPLLAASSGSGTGYTNNYYSFSIGGNFWIGHKLRFRNRGATNSQLVVTAAPGSVSDITNATTGGPQVIAIDTTVDQYVQFGVSSTTGAQCDVLEAFSVSIIPSA